jgi:chorismate dehydratase
MSVVPLGAVEYLNARPLVRGLEHSARFSLWFDVPSRCADLLHSGDIDVGLIPSIEYLRGDGLHGAGYRVVPGLAIASRGAVASVAIYATRPMADVRSLALDTSSRTSVALARVVCDRAFGIQPELYDHGPDLPAMLSSADAALMIGDKALFTESGTVQVRATAEAAMAYGGAASRREPPVTDREVFVEKVDLGRVWTDMTGLPFVYAFWAGRPAALDGEGVSALVEAKVAGVRETTEIAREYFGGAHDRASVGARYLRDNIRFELGPDELEGLDLFYRYAAEAGVINAAGRVRFY